MCTFPTMESYLYWKITNVSHSSESCMIRCIKVHCSQNIHKHMSVTVHEVLDAMIIALWLSLTLEIQYSNIIIGITDKIKRTWFVMAPILPTYRCTDPSLMHVSFCTELFIVHFTLFISSTVAHDGGDSRGEGRHPTGHPHSWRGVATSSIQSLRGHLHDHQTKGIFVSSIYVNKYELYLICSYKLDT